MMRTLILCHKNDEDAAKDFLKHLSMLIRNKILGVNIVFSDQSMIAKPEDVLIPLSEADAVVVLASSSLFNDDEMVTLIEQLRERKQYMIPIPLTECDLAESPLGGLVTLPRDCVPVMSRKKSEREEAWYQICVELRSIAKRFF